MFEIVSNGNKCFILYTYKVEGCPAKFLSANALFCYGACGDDWLDKQLGCQHSDANAYCKLKLCDKDAFATSFTLTPATHTPGFACDGVGVDYGDWFEITGVHFADDIKTEHGENSNVKVISNVTCQMPGKHSYYL